MKVLCEALIIGLQAFFEILRCLIKLDANAYASKSIHLKASKGVSLIPTELLLEILCFAVEIGYQYLPIWN